MQVGDAVLLWRSGRGGGIAARCTVVSEPEARPRVGLPPEVVVGLRVDRALTHPVAPATLARIPALRPLAFMDLLDETERRVTPAQEEALAVLVAERDEAAAADPDDVWLEQRTTVDVPVRLVPLVSELLAALGADDAAPGAAPGAAGGAAEGAAEGAAHVEDAPRPSEQPNEQHVAHAEALARVHGTAAFTLDDVAQVWRTGTGTARSRIDRLVDVGLVERAGTRRPDERPDGRPGRGRPPLLYRLARD